MKMFMILLLLLFSGSAVCGKITVENKIDEKDVTVIWSWGFFCPEPTPKKITFGGVSYLITKDLCKYKGYLNIYIKKSNQDKTCSKVWLCGSNKIPSSSNWTVTGSDGQYTCIEESGTSIKAISQPNDPSDCPF